MSLTAILLVGCTALAPIASKLLGSADDGISVDAQVGDRENEGALGESVQKGTGDIEVKDKAKVTVNNTQQTADAKIETADNVTVQNIPPWVFLLAILGWLLPTPQAMWKGLCIWRKKINHG